MLTSKEQLFLQVAKETVPDTKYTTEYFNRIFTLSKTVVATMSQIQKTSLGNMYANTSGKAQKMQCQCICLIY